MKLDLLNLVISIAALVTISSFVLKAFYSLCRKKWSDDIKRNIKESEEIQEKLRKERTRFYESGLENLDEKVSRILAKIDLLITHDAKIDKMESEIREIKTRLNK